MKKNERTTRIHTRVMHTPSSHTRSSQGNNKQADTRPARTTSPNSSSAIVSPDTIGNPFLRPIHNVVLPIPLGCSADIGNIRTSLKVEKVSKSLFLGRYISTKSEH